MKQLLTKTKLISVFILALILGCVNDDNELVPQILSSFTFNLDEDTGTVEFINISERASSYSWDFGDGTTSIEINPVKVYGASGTYTVVLTATNSAGATSTFETQITVVIKGPITLPITFDDEATVNFDVGSGTFGGASFEIVANPDESGSNDKATRVGAITNSGAEFEGAFFDLGTALDLTEDKRIQMNFWSEEPIAVLLKLEQGAGSTPEVSVNHGGTGWESIAFDFISSDSFSRLTLFVDGPGTTAGTFYVDDIEQTDSGVVVPECDEETAENIDPANGDLNWTFLTNDDTTLFDAFGNTSGAIVANPVVDGINTSCNVQQFVKATGCETFAGLGIELNTAFDFTASINKVFTMKVLAETQVTDVTLRLERLPFPDTDPAIERVASISAVGVWEELTFDFSDVNTGTYKSMIIYFERDAVCDGDVYYFDDIIQTAGGGSGDTTPPVITLVGDADITLTVGDTYTEEGATATDDVDGDISGSIVVGGDTVDTGAAGTYTVTYNVSDAAGNAATEVTRTVTVEEPFDSGLLTNGDFESGADPWIQGVDDMNPAPVVTEMGNTFYQVNITTPDPGQPFLVNLSQKLEIVQDETYTLTFDAWSDTNRSIIAGIGLSGGSFANTTQTVDLTTSQQTFVLELTATGFGALDARVLFDVNGEAGLVNIDNVSLVLGGSGGGGDTTPPVITLSGDAVIDLIQNDPFTDPGASALDDTDGDISGSIMVGGDTVNTLIVGMYVITYDVSDAAGNAATQVTRTVNVTAFDSGLLTNGDFESGAAPWIQGVDDMNPAPVVTEMGNTFDQTNVTTPDPGQPFLVNVSQKLEIVQDAMYTLTFDAWSDTDRSIIAGIGLSGGSFANTTQTVSINTTRQTYTLMLTATGFGAADARVLFDLNGEAGLVNIDNVSLVLDSMGGGGGCTGGPTGNVNAFPVDFEDCEGFPVSFGDDQSRAIVDNPVSGGINTSDKVYQFIKLAGGSGFGGFQNLFDTGTFINNSTVTFKIYSTLPNQEIRLEIIADPNPGGVGNPAPYVQTLATANQWVEMSFDLSANPFPNSGDETVYTLLVVKPGNVDPGTTPADVTFYVDDFAITPN